MLLTRLPLTFQQTQDGMPRFIAYDYSRADWNGLYDHLGDVPWEDIFKLRTSAAVSEFCEWVQVGMMYISLIVSIKSSLTRLHGFQLLVQLP